MAAGLDPSQFWTLTYREIDVCLAGAGERLEREQNGRAWLAWHIEALGRTKRLPKLDRLYVQKRQRQTPQQMQAVVRAWMAAGERQAKA